MKTSGLLDGVPRETHQKLVRFADLLRDENERQNLVSRGTIAAIWERHILDSAQLVALNIPGGNRWADIGSGAGLPGIVTAILTGLPTTLIEPRRLRADFLRRLATDLDLANVIVAQTKAQTAEGQFDVITARAVAKAGEILGITRHLAHKGTTYLLMKGRTAQSELDALRTAWHGRFTLVPSLTEQEAGIIVASNVAPRGRG